MGERGLGRVLIVDDEADIRETIEQFLTTVGYKVASAADVPTALATLPQGFDAVLCDIRLPGADGIDFLREAHRTNPALGVFLITGFPTLETLIDAKQHGAVAYLRKPLVLSEVAARLRAFLTGAAR